MRDEVRDSDSADHGRRTHVAIAIQMYTALQSVTATVFERTLLTLGRSFDIPFLM